VYDWAIWAALIAGGVALGIAIARLVAQIAGTLRQFKRTRRHLIKELDRVTAGAEAMAANLAVTEDVTGRLEASLARLQVSLARLKVLTDALDEVDAKVRRIGWLSPYR
jgi:mevalonate kinase